MIVLILRGSVQSLFSFAKTTNLNLNVTLRLFLMNVCSRAGTQKHATQRAGTRNMHLHPTPPTSLSVSVGVKNIIVKYCEAETQGTWSRLDWEGYRTGSMEEPPTWWINSRPRGAASVSSWGRLPKNNKPSHPAFQYFLWGFYFVVSLMQPFILSLRSFNSGVMSKSAPRSNDAPLLWDLSTGD